MRAVYVPTSSPGAEPLTTTEAKLHLRVTSSSEDTLIADLITAARMHCENITRRPLSSQTWEMYLDGFPGGYGIWSEFLGLYVPSEGDYVSDMMVIEKTPVVSVEKVSYVAYSTENGAYTDLTVDTDYQVDLKSMFPRIVPAYNKVWPDTRPMLNAVRVQFTMGYANPAAVPMPIKQAMKMLVAAWYGPAREAIATGNGVTVSTLPKPVSVDWILAPMRAWRF